MIKLLTKLGWNKDRSLLIPFLAVLVFSILLNLPLMLTKGVTFGHDIVFHYNRFYETAMQIKEGNFSYFISLYGYQHSGRIVNALYGPFFAYFQGILVLIAGTWFRYQILSNIILGIIAGLSSYTLMRELGAKKAAAIWLSLVFITTYSVQYWWAAQGFTSWGAAFYPLCLITALKTLKTKKVHWVSLGLSVALMFQVHVLSTLFLVLTYVPLYLAVFLKIKDKLTFIRQGLCAVVLAILMTTNVWLPLVYLNLENTLKAPFINKDFLRNSITGDNAHMLYRPYALMILFALMLYLVYRERRQLSVLVKSLLPIFLVFTWLATNFFPWSFFTGLSLVKLIQFPFRFFLYAVPVGITLLGSVLPQKRWVSYVLAILALTSATETIYLTSQNIAQYYQTGNFMSVQRHTTFSGDAQAIQDSLHDTDLSRLVTLAEKSTPDYVLEHKNGSYDVRNSRYKLYERSIILASREFDKVVGPGQVTLRWYSNKAELKNIPIIVYKDSQVKLNDQDLPLQLNHLSVIGTPTVQAKEGENVLILTYKNPNWLPFALVLPILTLIILLIYRLLSQYKGGGLDEATLD